MKYFVLVCDGMADRPIAALGGKTPMEAAVKPMMDTLAAKSLCGTVSNVPEGMVPESDTANLAILSYDPKIYSKGRSPLEAMSMGLTMQPDETAYRCNVVTLSEDGDYDEDTVMMDALEAGAADFTADGPVFEITTDPDAFNDVIAALEAKGYTFASADISLVPQTYVKLTSEEDVKNMEKLLDMLEDNEDVQNTYHNWDQD